MGPPVERRNPTETTLSVRGDLLRSLTCWGGLARTPDGFFGKGGRPVGPEELEGDFQTEGQR